MVIHCQWEHNGPDSIVHALDLPGAFARGPSLEIALAKMKKEVCAYQLWAGARMPEDIVIEVVKDVPTELDVKDADSDVLFDLEKEPLSEEEYRILINLTLKSARDFQTLYDSIPDKDRILRHVRPTFYGTVPATANEMYLHTKNVNNYYFAEIDVDADNEGTIWQCRTRGFSALERKPDYLLNPVIEGSYGEYWTVRKVMRRFIWHDRIHAKAMYRWAVRAFGKENIPDPFFFESLDNV